MRLRRRDVIAALAGAVIARPLAARAEPAVPVVGFLHSQSPEDFARMVVAFRRGLGEAGYVDGRNVTIEYRWAESHLDRLPTLAAELVARNVTVIATLGGPATALAARAATTTIPIVFASGTDPIAGGLVQSLNRPGGDLTGVTFFAAETLGKRVEFMRQIKPGATLAVLINPDGADAPAVLREIAALEQAGQKLTVRRAATEAELKAVFVTSGERRPRMLILGGDPFFQAHAKTIAALAERNHVAVAGGGSYPDELLNYGINLADAYRQVGTLVGKILGGAKPADLPVQRVDQLELIINLKIAKALGLTIPTTLLARADKVIE
jgi:putative tryptophan/tyrosine transport system substrate-binding protein